MAPPPPTFLAWSQDSTISTGTTAAASVKWEDLVAPAITLADEGFVLDEALPTTIAEGRRLLEKWPEAAKIYLPGGKVPRPGDRFFNKDYATTLRAIQKGGADAFYRGEIAKKIAADMEENGGILAYADLAQYRAIEREPVSGTYRGHTLYAAARRCRPASSCSSRCTCWSTTSRGPGARSDARCGLLPLPHRVVEGARPAAPRGRPRALARGLRGAPDVRAREGAVRQDRRQQGVALRAAGAGGWSRGAVVTADGDAADLDRHDVVCGGRCRGQHDCGHPDAQHLGRHLLRVEGAGLPL